MSGVGAQIPHRALTPLRTWTCPLVVNRPRFAPKNQSRHYSSRPRVNGPQCLRLRSTTAKRKFHASRPSLATKDPYRVLGVTNGATASDIKKAYYGLAKKYHPDTNKDTSAKERFSEAQSAYEILSDTKKKEMWDQYGAAAFDQGGGFDPSGGASGAGPFGGAAGGNPFSGFQSSGGFSADFSFEDLFGAFTGGRRGRGGSRRAAEEVMVGEDIEIEAKVTFMEAAKGVSKTINLRALEQCKTCTGSGLKKGTKRMQCKSCGGTGTQVHFMQGGFQMASTCQACGGQKFTIPRGSECGTCSGNGVVRQKRAVNIDIPAGIDDGTRVRYTGQGDAPPTGLAPNPDSRSQKGDLHITVRVAPDSKFSRLGSDVLYTASIPVTTAILGGEVTIPTLENEVKVRVGTGTNTGDKITLSGMGMKTLSGRRGQFGDMRVEFKVAMPKSLTSSQRAMLEMLADELDDKTARRVMHPAKSSGSASQSAKDEGPTSEGFLKSAWHKFTHKDQQPEPGAKKTSEAKTTSETRDDDDEPKKAAGSG
ncbi:MAG: hypothetical protein M1814_002959 [Vezdaea aestivalis]|nr:MAG: hypothetical protein M1814_002959 [Vezdaea aestivalis]